MPSSKFVIQTSPYVEIVQGITTYDYILAVRDQEQGLREGDGMDSMMSSPASSAATGLSGYSSSGGLAWHQGVLCTPPRMFVEHQQVCRGGISCITFL